MVKAKHSIQIALFIGFLFFSAIACASTATHPTPVEQNGSTGTGLAATPSDSPKATQTTPTRAETPQVTETHTPSNAMVMTSLAQTPRPTLAQMAAAKEMGITPGVTTEEQVKARLGEPSYTGSRSQGITSWFWQKPLIPNLAGIDFSGRIVQEVVITTPKTTAEGIVAQYSFPDAVILFPGYDSPTPSVPTTPSTPAPVVPPHGFLLYLTYGIQVKFSCTANIFSPCPAVRSCTGVPRQVSITDKTYTVAMSLEEWIKRQESPDRTFCIRPWLGFSD